MTRTVYVNGRYLRYAEAGVHVEDRGFQFADSVYEVCEVNGGRLVDLTRHLKRLERSLAELKIPRPMSDAALGHILRQVIRRNRVAHGLVYLQVTRGQAPRDFPFPSVETSPTLVALARAIDPAKVAARAMTGIGVKSVPDTRWARCDLKTVMLLPACLAKEAAKAEGAQEAWFVDETGFVTEGASSNAWIVTADNRLVTRGVGPDILAGVTRRTLIDVIAALQLKLEERAFSLAEAYCAREAFVSSASATVMPVVRLDGHQIGDGSPGPVSLRLRSAFHQMAEISAG